MRVLLTGVSGFIGAELLPRLLEQGHEVRALARDRARVKWALRHDDSTGLGELDLVIGDTLTGAGLRDAMRDVEVAYYLIHSMESSTETRTFAAREQASATAFAQAARAAGVRRIVYLGGPLPDRRDASPHLASRHAVEQILLEAVPDSVALRASIVIGARSRSFRFMVRLVERLPVLTLPAWRSFRTQPIDERDILEMLSICATSDSISGRSLDVAGPDILTYGQMIQGIAELMLVGRPSIGLNVTLTPIAARLAAVLTSESPDLVLPLMEGLDGDLLAADDSVAALLGVELHSFESAVEHALYEWEKVEPLAAR